MFTPEDRRDIDRMFALTALCLAFGVIFYTAGLVTEAAGSDPVLFEALAVISCSFAIVALLLTGIRMAAIYYKF